MLSATGGERPLSGTGQVQSTVELRGRVDYGHVLPQRLKRHSSLTGTSQRGVGESIGATPEGTMVSIPGETADARQHATYRVCQQSAECGGASSRLGTGD